MRNSDVATARAGHEFLSTDFLTQLDADWAQLIATVGSCSFEPKPEREPYEALIRAVAYQQLHGKAGDAIIRRFLDIYRNAFPTPEQLLATEFDTLRACGFSARKIETIQGIAAGALNGLVPASLDADVMSDAELIERLVALKGIGRWTAQMFLLFRLGRPDILSELDLGIRKAVQKLYTLPELPSYAQVEELGQQWSPYRSVASWYLWRSLE